MTPKEYLEEAEHLRKRIKRKMLEVELAGYRAEGMNGNGFSDMPHSPSPNLQKQEIAMERHIELQNELKEIQNSLNMLVEDMRRRIDSLENSDMRDVMTKRYIEFKEWRTVANECFISERTAYYLHRKALMELPA